MLFGILFASWRFMEIITLIPTVGMLSYFVHQYVIINALTPDPILILFIVSVLAVVWAIATLFSYHRSKTNGMFVSFIDLCFVGAFIGAVWVLRGINNDNCASLTNGSYTGQVFGIFSVTYTGLGITFDKGCAMLKACWIFGIMNCIMFAITSFLAFWVSGSTRTRTTKETYVVREHRSSRNGHRRSGSHRSHRSSHSSRRPYI